MQDEYRQPSVFSNQMKIRKLTPVECWRLMGFKDEDFFKAQAIGLSNTKLYERAGRGIVVPMLESIFRNMMLNEE
jgi:DNA (cytosine-5)-methyltransferase 1